MRTKEAWMIAAILTCGIVGAQAQQVDYQQKNEFGISIGAAASSSIIDDLSDVELIAISGGKLNCDNSKRVGALSAEYFRRVHRAIALGGVFSYSHVKKDVLQNKTVAGNVKINYLTIMPTAKFDWLRRNHFGLYSKLGLGVTLRTQKANGDGIKDKSTDTDCFFNYQVSLIGIEAGSQRVRAFGELGFGEQGIALAGLRYKF